VENPEEVSMDPREATQVGGLQAAPRDHRELFKSPLLSERWKAGFTGTRQPSNGLEVSRWLITDIILFRHPVNPMSNLDSNVLELEKEYDESLNIGSLSLAPETFPSRPGFGTRGERHVIWTNYYQLLVDPRLVFHQYHIDIRPKAVGRKRFRIIQLFLQRPESSAMSDRICSDFKSTLLSRTLLDEDFIACNIVYRSEFENEPGPRATVYHPSLQHTKTLPVRGFLESLTTTSLSTAVEDRDALIQAFNIFLNHFAKCHSNLVSIGSKTFPKGVDGRNLGGGLVAIRGFPCINSWRHTGRRTNSNWSNSSQVLG
jgi:hypothetical protein